MAIIELDRRYRTAKQAAADALHLGTPGWYVAAHPDRPAEFALRLEGGIRAATIVRYLRKHFPLSVFRIIDSETGLEVQP